MRKERPPHIPRAIVSGNIEQLRVSGAAGGGKSAKVQRERQANLEALELFHRERREKQEWDRRVEANEHLVPPDPDLGDS
jgi:hypothetical protein